LESYEDFIKLNIEPKLRTTYYGDASTLSARVILSRMVSNIVIPSVDINVDAPVHENE
jgi:C4-type Zn-finger protein